MAPSSKEGHYKCLHPVGVGVNICCDPPKENIHRKQLTAMTTEKKTKYLKYITSEEWYNLKIDLLKIRGCKCQKCGKRKHPTRLHIHHLTYERLYNERSEDLLILCAVCHMKEHGLIKKPVKHKKKGFRRKKKNISQKIYQRERAANEKFTADKRRRMKGKKLPSYM